VLAKWAADAFRWATDRLGCPGAVAKSILAFRDLSAFWRLFSGPANQLSIGGISMITSS
jgi:hypothetical protein